MSNEDKRANQVVSSKNLSGLDVESSEYVAEFLEDANRVEPHVDFGKPENFAKYGSAQEYYDQALKWIYNEYPYDGSLKEKLEWKNNSTLLDTYIFDNRYPKTTGYVTLTSDGYNGTSVTADGYGTTTTDEYISFQGGPHTTYDSLTGVTLKEVFDSKSNVWDDTVTSSAGAVDATRESNLKCDIDEGVTVEFWLQTGSIDASVTEKQVVFDLWNGIDYDDADLSASYGRIRIELTSSVGSPFLVTVMSGTTGYSQESIGSGLDQDTLSSWKHCAFSFASGSTGDIVTKFYQNGTLNDTLTTGSNIGEILNPIEARLGALITEPSGSSAPAGSGKLSGSLDEFRFWKTRRTSKEIGRYWFTSNLGGGTNTDDANLDLGVYYKFNEGITTNDTTDASILDYSGRISNGTWEGYPGSSARSTSSAIDAASAGTEDKDPIIHSIHPEIAALATELQGSGSVWDYENNSSLFYTMPSWIIDEDEGNGDRGDLKILTQIMGSYFDNTDLLIGELPKLNVASYPSSSTQGELYKPYPYAQTALRSHGLTAPELFSNSSVLEYYANRSETQEYEKDIHDVKNLIYNNIFNNLTDIYKSKGTEKAFRNLIRCFGVDDSLIRINSYADNNTYKFETKYRTDSHKTKAVNFNHVDRFGGTVYQNSSSGDSNTVSFISGSDSAAYEDGFPITIETEVVFPKKIDSSEEHADTQEFPHLSASLFGMHTANDADAADMTWASSDDAEFQVFAARDTLYSKDAKFVMSSSVLGEIETDYYLDTYNNSKWNFAVRLKPHGYPHSFASGALDAANDYTVEFYGVNYIADRKMNEFSLSGSVSKTLAESFLTAPKRLFVGAHRTNYTGSVLQKSDVKTTSLRYWMDYLDDTAIKYHALDPSNFGHPRPNRGAYLLESDLPDLEVPEIETLALFWDFDGVTTSDTDGEFVVSDISSGSVADSSRYGWLGNILKMQHTGKGFDFPESDTDVVENQYLHASKQQLPEMVFGDDNIRVLSQEETEVFTKETRPTSTYYSFEKSMYQVISDEIINYFGSIVDFNNLVGEPKNRYRQEYKGLKHIRQFFFERVGNTPDLDKFVNYYKWIDATLEEMLMQLTPASARHSDGIDNIVESHILERNKYWNKFPTLTQHASTEGGAENTTALPSWKHAHRPISNLENENCEYWNDFAERTDAPISSGDAGVDASRTAILNAKLQTTNRSYTSPQRNSVELNPAIRGGVNYSSAKKTDLYRGINMPHGPMTSMGLPKNVLFMEGTDVKSLPDCNDDIPAKRKMSFGTRDGRTYDGGITDGITGEIAAPFNIYSASAGMGGYNSSVQSGFHAGVQITNLHNDSYGDVAEVPMQGTFTEVNVGGHQSRHISLNDGTDNQYNRPESWRLLVGTASIGLTGPDYGGPYPDPTRQRAWFFREETAKRPVNIKNIKQADGVLANYNKTYEIVQTSGRSTNNLWLGNHTASLLPERYATDFPQTTNVHTMVGVRPYSGNFSRGNTFIPGANVLSVAENVKALRRVGNRFFPHKTATPEKRTIFPLPDRGVQDAVIVERFSAPGGPEINSLGFLDVMAAEKSVYNALPWRNLSVLGSGSGEDVQAFVTNDTIKVNDHLGHRRGLRTLTSLHAGPFGSDATYGSIVSSRYSEFPSFHKINRNALLRMEGEEGSYTTASSYDNWSIQHAIPQNDSQYSWITGSLSEGVTAFGHGTTPTFVSSSMPDYSGSYTKDPTVGSTTVHELPPVDFVGLNSVVHDAVGTEFNILSSSGGTIVSYDGGLVPEGVLFVNTIASNISFNALMLHRNGAYGYPSWKQIDNRYHPLVRNMRENNTVSIIDPETTREVTRRKSGYLGYKWSPTPANDGDIFGILDQYNVTTDRSVLSYREPAIVQRYAPLKLQVDMEIGGKIESVTIDATYANEKSHFSNSKLDMNLNLYNYGESGADLVLGSLADGTLVGDLKSIKYTETVYPKAINTYLSKIRSRTEYVCPFWRDARSDRAEENAVGAMGNIIPSQSMWNLDGRLDPDDTATVASEGGTEGVLQNSYNTVHSRPGPTAGCPLVAGSVADITASATYTRRHTNAAPATALPFSSFITNSSGGIIPFSGDAPWDTAAQSGKTPFYDSYGEYVENMRLKGKDYSIVPEYRMSDRIEDYLINGVNPFEDSALFSITGAVSASSSTTDNFYTVYSHSDFMKYFDVVESEAEQQAGMKATDITVKCKALLKLLPYDGFYPATRTVQMATLFSSSYGEHVSSSASSSVGGVQENGAGSFRPFLTPVFAPGIVYNTVKSGLAVDFPIMTGAYSITSSTNQESWYIKEDNFHSRVPFEAIIEPQVYLKNTTLADMEPHPSASIGGYTGEALAEWNGAGDNRYKLAMNNFLAETPEFFLKNGTFTSFFSDTEENFNVAEAGTTYKMRVVLRKSHNGSGSAGHPQIADGQETICMYSRPTAFGPPSFGCISGNGGSQNGYNAPFTPPYYDGSARAILEFTPTETKKHTLEEILSQTTASYSRYLDLDDCTDSGEGPQTQFRVNDNAVQVSASVNLFGTTLGLQDLLKYEGVNLSTQESRWCIQTKFETPILNFVDASASATPITDTGDCKGGIRTRPYGMWHQYGRLPQGDEGIYMELDNFSSENSPSLADLVGFSKTSERLGQVASSKTISEAVVAVPFIEVENSRQFFDVTVGETMSDSVTKMVDAMSRFVFPPSMDFVSNPEDVNPFAMYVFEFEHQLSQQDLTDIWQNLPPRIGRAFDTTTPLDSSEIVQEKQVTHSLVCGELLEKADAKLQWMIFKVKQRAQTNYWDKTVATNPTLTDPDKSGLVVTTMPKIALPTAGAGGVLKDNTKEYNYNWPYDFFSLVELVKIDEEIGFTKDKVSGTDTLRELADALVMSNAASSLGAVNTKTDIAIRETNLSDLTKSSKGTSENAQAGSVQEFIATDGKATLTSFPSSVPDKMSTTNKLK